MTETTTEDLLDDGLQWATNERGDFAMSAMKSIIYMHLASNEEYLPDVLAHLAGNASWAAVSSMLEDIWTDAVGDVLGEISQSFFQAALRTALYEGDSEEIAAQLPRGVTEGIAA